MKSVNNFQDETTTQRGKYEVKKLGKLLAFNRGEETECIGLKAQYTIAQWQSLGGKDKPIKHTP
jgi:hypothetical protein